MKVISKDIEFHESTVDVVIMNKESKVYDLNKEDMNKVGKGLLIAVGGTVLTYVTDMIPLIEWGEYKPIVVGISCVLVNFLRKYLQGN